MDNPKNKPIKVQIKPQKGTVGKVNLKFYGTNRRGAATIMIQKVSGGEFVHVKTLAFRVVKYLLDGFIDGEFKERDLNMFKVEGTQNEKHKLEESLTCEFCHKTLKTINGKNIHKSRIHKEENNVVTDKIQEKKCAKCGFIFKDTEALEIHMIICSKEKSNIKEEESPMDCDVIPQMTLKVFQCEFCDLKFMTQTNLEGLQKVQEHHKSCLCKPAAPEELGKFVCENCEFISAEENRFKRHIRDNHDINTVSTSPKPKRRRKKNIDYTEEKMEIDDSGDILIQRSKMWDDKIEEKRKKHEKLEEEQQRNKRKQEELEKSEEKKKRIEKRNSKRMSRKNQKRINIKPYLRELPEAVKNIIGGNYYVYPVVGDGSCGLRTIAAWIFQDQTLGPFLGREINRMFVKNWNFWKSFFLQFPFTKQLGTGTWKTWESEEELHNFLLNDKEGAFMWRGQEDFVLVSSLYNFKMKIITIEGDDDENPVVTNIEPNEEIVKESEIPDGKVSDLIMLHRKNVHYDLIVPKSSEIAKEGGLDYQRMKNSEAEKKKHENEEEKNTKENEENKPEEEEDKNEDEKEKSQKVVRQDPREQKINDLEKKICDMEIENKNLLDKIEALENENRRLKCSFKEQNEEKCQLCSFCGKLLKYDEKIDKHEQECHTIDSVLCDTCGKTFGSLINKTIHIEKEHVLSEKLEENDISFIEERVLKTRKNEGYLRINPQNEAEKKVSNEEFKCDVCSIKLYARGLLQKHINDQHSLKSKIQCVNCGKVFATELQLGDHMKEDHRNNRANCDICEKSFTTKVQLVNHKAREHEITLTEMKQYNCNDCAFQCDSWVELKKHSKITRHKPRDQNETCYTCNQEFSSYRQLMNHRKLVHPSKKTCRYFLKQECVFDEDSCWYVHKKENTEKNEGVYFKCDDCESIFPHTSELMKHKKQMHKSQVPECLYFLQGTCKRNNNTCWFLHKNEDSREVNENFDEKIENLDFQKAEKKAPPDQMTVMMNRISNLSLKVEQLQKMRRETTRGVF